MEDQMTALALWLRERAAAVGCNPEERGGTAELARRSGLDVGQVSRALRGKSIPNARNAVQLAAALEVPVDEMLQRVNAQTRGEAQPAIEPRESLTSEQWVARLGLKDPADRSLLLAMVDRMKLAQREREEIHGVSGRVAELAYRLAQQDIHVGEVPEVVSELQRLSEDLDLGEESQDYRQRGAAPTIIMGEPTAE